MNPHEIKELIERALKNEVIDIVIFSARCDGSSWYTIDPDSREIPETLSRKGLASRSSSTR